MKKVKSLVLQKLIRSLILTLILGMLQPVLFHTQPVQADASSRDTHTVRVSSATVTASTYDFSFGLLSSGTIIDMSEDDPDESGDGWTYANNVYTIQDGAEVTVTGTSENQRRIVVAEDAKATIILDNTSIIFNNQSPLHLNSGADVTLILADGTNNTLKSSSRSGLQLSSNAALTISGTGSLTAQGSLNGAGIGGCPNNWVCSITIDGGTVTAPGGDSGAGIGGGGMGAGGFITINGGKVFAKGGDNGAAGIGGGHMGAGGTITINGGTVTATGGNNGAGIGGGSQRGGGTITINGGTVTATGGDNGAGIGGGRSGNGGHVTIEGGTVIAIAGDGAVAIGKGLGGNDHGSLELSGYTYNGLPGYRYWTNTTPDDTDKTEGTVFPLVPSNDYQYIEIRPNTAIINMSDDDPDESGDGWTYAHNVYTIQDDADVIVVGTSANERRIEVAENAKATITLHNATITGLGANQSPLLLNSGANVTLILADGTTNQLKAGDYRAGIEVPEGSTLIIDGTGILTASGGIQAAGIGGGNGREGGSVTIAGGTVTAQGGNSGAGIGGGFGSKIGSVTITGGTVTAQGGNSGAGIGGGIAGKGGSVTIEGGTVIAIAGDNAVAIGKGSFGSDNGTLNLNGYKNYDYWTNTTADETEAAKGTEYPLELNDNYYRYIKIAPDATPPIPGDGGTITASDVTHDALALAWTAASDNTSKAENLKYYVYRSKSTMSGTTPNGVLLNDAGGNVNMTSYSVEDLSPNTKYYFIVVVEDETGNKAAYTAVEVTTDLQDPVVHWPEDLTATYGETLEEIQLPGNGTGTPGSFSWTAGGSTSVGNAGTSKFNLTFTPLETEIYKTVTQDVYVEVMPKSLTLTADDKTIVVGDPEPVYTYTVSGLAGSDTAEDVIIDPPVLAVPGFSSSAPATFRIEISGGTVNGNYNIANRVNGTLTVVASGSGGSPGSDDDSPGSGGSPGSGYGSSPDGSSISVIILPPEPDQPDAPTKAVIRAGTVDMSGSIIVHIPDTIVDVAFEMAMSDARTRGHEQNGIQLVIDVETGSEAGSRIEVHLPKAAQETMIARRIAGTVVVVDHPDLHLEIGIDLGAVEEIYRQADSDVTVAVAPIDSTKLGSEARDAIGSRPAFDLRVNDGGGSQVRNFGDGRITITIPYTLGEQEKPGNIRAVHIDDNGTVHWLEDSVYDDEHQVLRFSTNHFSVFGVGYREEVPAPVFTDIENHWAKEDIEFVARQGLFRGTSETTFSPDMAMTRGMFVTVIGRLAQADPGAYTESSFTDVRSDAYYRGYVEWARRNSIVSGVGNGRFAPDQPVTREQMAVILYNYAKAAGITLPKVHEESSFADSGRISAYARDAVAGMQMAGIVNGKGGNVFDPQGTATRAEVAAVLRRFAETAISGNGVGLSGN